LVTKALERNPGPLAYYESALALCSYFAGDQRQAVTWIERTTVPKSPLYHLIAAAIYGEAGDKAGAERERAWLMENAPALVKTARQEVTFRLGRPRDAEFFLQSLAKAGFDVGV
jgi:hypothetical protein